jgi:hypothetical protein
MFIQVIQGTVSDAGAVLQALDRWGTDLSGGAAGWLGSTSGVTDDGTFVTVVRFESEDAARRNSQRPEQDQWWTETSKLFSGEVTFHDCREVFSFLRGGSDDAGFVQVIQGRVADTARMRELMDASSPLLAEYRPEIIGGTIALHGDGGFTEAVYFTSEEEAREGERKELPPELRDRFEEEMSQLSDVSYLDLREPWLRSPR